jgi:signal transduction histidine kinase
MVLAVLGVAGLAYWDQERESALALEDFGAEQERVAELLAGELATSLRAGVAPAALLAGAAETSAGRMRILLRGPKEDLGRWPRSAPIEAAVAAGSQRARLSPSEAAELGLPARTAIAGLAEVAGPGPDGGRWRVAAVTSAWRERDRGFRTRNRILLAVLAAGGLVLGFGGLALYRQRKELELARALELADLRRQRDERLEHLDKAATLGTLAIGIAHEVSTPLGVISGRAEQLLPRVAADERAKEAARVILAQAGRIGEIIRALLSLARGGSASFSRIRPEQIAENARGLVDHRFTSSGTRLEIDIPRDLPAIDGDQLLLEHALVNLLKNACEACPRGGKVALELRVEGPWLVFRVLDDGAGISDEAAARATEPFFTTKAQQGGTGLGLAIVNEILAHHGGKLSIRPRAPRGTEVRIEIPAKP